MITNNALKYLSIVKVSGRKKGSGPALTMDRLTRKAALSHSCLSKIFMHMHACVHVHI